MKPHHKYNVISIFITFSIISLLILSGPASAIDVSLTTQDIDVLDTKPVQFTKFTIQVKVNEGEFLPVLYTNLIFDKDLTCKITEKVEDCSFLTLVSKTIQNLNYKQDYGYGYGYNSSEDYGYQDFGYGYGYGYGEKGKSGTAYGLITYVLKVDPTKLPGQFVGKTIDVEAIVYGGTEDNKAHFKGSGSFKVSSSEVPIETPDITQPVQQDFGSTKLDVPADALPAGTTAIIVKQINKDTVVEPPSTSFKILSKVYNFELKDAVTTVFNKPVTLTIYYTDEELDLVGITDESKILPYYFDTITNSWSSTGLVITERDTVNNKIVFTTTHFTQFTLLADVSTPATTTTIPNLREDTIETTTSEEKLTLETLTYPNCRADTDCLAEETCENTGGFYKQCVKTTTLVTTPEAGITPTGAAGITGMAIIRNLTKNPVAVTIVIIIILAIIIFCYFYFRNRKTAV